MSEPETPDGAEGWLSRVVERSGRLLRVTHDVGGTALDTLAFTFDVGTIRLEAAEGALTASGHAPGEAEAGSNADEEDPWWTVLGNPLTRVQEHEGGLLLQFREDAHSPKIVLLVPAGGGLSVRVVV